MHTPPLDPDMPMATLRTRAEFAQVRNVSDSEHSGNSARRDQKQEHLEVQGVGFMIAVK